MLSGKLTHSSPTVVLLQKIIRMTQQSQFLLQRYLIHKTVFLSFVVQQDINCLNLIYLCSSFFFKTPPPKCQDCRQFLDDSDLKFFQGDPDNAVRISST